MNKKIDNLPVQREPRTRQEGKFEGKEGLSYKELAEFLGVSKSTVRKHMALLPHMYLGSRLIFPKSAVLEWLKEQSMKNRQDPNKMEVEGAILRKLSS